MCVCVCVCVCVCFTKRNRVKDWMWFTEDAVCYSLVAVPTAHSCILVLKGRKHGVFLHLC